MVTVVNTRGQYLVREVVSAYFEDPLDIPLWINYMKIRGYKVVVPAKLSAVPEFSGFEFKATAIRNKTRRSIMQTRKTAKKIARKM